MIKHDILIIKFVWKIMEFNITKKIGLREISLIIAILILIIQIGDSANDCINVDFYKPLFFFFFGDVFIPIILIISIYFNKLENKNWRYFFTIAVITYFIIGIISNYTSFGKSYYSTNDMLHKWDVYLDLVTYCIVCLCVIYKKYFKLVDVLCLGSYVFGLMMAIYNIRIGDAYTGLYYVVYYIAWSLMFIFIYPDEGYSKVLNSKSVIGKSTRRLAVIIISASFVFTIIRVLIESSPLLSDSISRSNVEIIAFSIFLAIVWAFITYYNNHINEEDIKNKRKLEEAYMNNEVLLAEVHHRVKNNLTVLSSFINIEKRKSSNEDAKKILTSIQNRIMTMTLVHSNLYETLDFGEVNAKKYIEELTSNILKTANRDDITFNLDIDDINIDIDIISPIGLIINESIINSYKYAFPNQGGVISINLKEKNSNCVLTLTDNGIGCSKKDLKSNTGMGSMIIEVLVSQIDGEMTINTESGVKRAITFENKIKQHIDIK